MADCQFTYQRWPVWFRFTAKVQHACAVRKWHSCTVLVNIVKIFATVENEPASLSGGFS